MSAKEKLLQKYAENLSHSDGRSQYIKTASDFLDDAAGLDRASIDEYLAMLRKHYAPGTVNFRFRVIRRLYAVNDIPWPYKRGEAPVIKQRDEYRPQLSPRIVEMMVRTAREGKLMVDECCFLALGTVYGLRRGEIANLTPNDINLKKNALYVATVKFGRERHHIIPPEIKPYIEWHDFNRRYGPSTINNKFKSILAKSCGMSVLGQKLGWHSLRRAVFDGLINGGVDVMAARTFMRLKSAVGEMAMPARCFGNVIVDIGETGPVLEEAKGDDKIFERHPFLPFWRNDA